MRNWNQLSQLKLFDSCQSILADDDRGRIIYIIPSFDGVPKTSEAVGERISLACRVKPEQPPPKASRDSGVHR
jgi:hypothetical protein